MAFTTRLLALIGVVMLAGAAAPAPQAGDWTRTVTQTAAGSFVMGNPAAPVKLIEYLSYTCPHCAAFSAERSEEHTSELQSLMRISYAVFCLKKKRKNNNKTTQTTIQI